MKEREDKNLTKKKKNIFFRALKNSSRAHTILYIPNKLHVCIAISPVFCFVVFFVFFRFLPFLIDKLFCSFAKWCKNLTEQSCLADVYRLKYCFFVHIHDWILIFVTILVWSLLKDWKRLPLPLYYSVLTWKSIAMKYKHNVCINVAIHSIFVSDMLIIIHSFRSRIDIECISIHLFWFGLLPSKNRI